MCQHTVGVTVLNQPPVANPDNTTTGQGVPVSLVVTTNDTDVDGTVDVATVDLDPATPGIQTSLTTAAGSYTVNNTGQVTFSPVGSFTGVTAIPYTVNDNLGLTSLTALITIGVGAGVPPVALADNATTPSGTSTTICVLANDSNSGGTGATTATVTAPVFTQPANGTVTADANGCLVFTPTPGFSGTTVFSYTICDPVTGLCASTTVGVTVLNQPPVANPDNTTTGQGVPVSLVVTAMIQTPMAPSILEQ